MGFFQLKWHPSIHHWFSPGLKIFFGFVSTGSDWCADTNAYSPSWSYCPGNLRGECVLAVGTLTVDIVDAPFFDIVDAPFYIFCWYGWCPLRLIDIVDMWHLIPVRWIWVIGPCHSKVRGEWTEPTKLQTAKMLGSSTRLWKNKDIRIYIYIHILVYSRY